MVTSTCTYAFKNLYAFKLYPAALANAIYTMGNNLVKIGIVKLWAEKEKLQQHISEICSWANCSLNVDVEKPIKPLVMLNVSFCIFSKVFKHFGFTTAKGFVSPQPVSSVKATGNKTFFKYFVFVTESANFCLRKKQKIQVIFKVNWIHPLETKKVMAI